MLTCCLDAKREWGKPPVPLLHRLFKSCSRSALAECLQIDKPGISEYYGVKPMTQLSFPHTLRGGRVFPAKGLYPE
ncbi:MAG: hypothetical protein F6K56_40845 [Moorea sp. SIO3G5]|nr:hypothetical protein [Moorena sp. SIO3G5]